MSSSQEMPALDSLRTVEFRQTLRGYHIDDVDEYLERVAVEADALREQMRQTADRLRQATDRIVALESRPGDASAPEAMAAAAPRAAEDSLQRTLVLAQKFVEQTEAEARDQARTVVEEAHQRARDMVAEAEQRARAMADESEKRLREEVTRLEGQRTKLAGDVEAISRYLDTERARLRGVLADMLHWVEETVQPPAAAKPPAAEPTDAAPAAGAPRGSSVSPPSGEGRVGAESRQPAEAATGAGAGVAAGATRPGLQTVSQGNIPNGAPSR